MTSRAFLQMMSALLICCLSRRECSAFPHQQRKSGDTEPKSYLGYQVWRIFPSNDEQFHALEHLWVNDTKLNLDFWRPPTKSQPADVLVPPELKDDLSELLNAYNILSKPLITNLQDKIEKKKIADHLRGEAINFDDSTHRSLIALNQYHSYAEIQQYMHTLERTYPNLCQVIKLGTTHEGRAIELLKVTNPAAGPANKRAFWIDAGIHAREWIAPAVAIYSMNQLVERYASNHKSKELVDNMIWYILPVVNPDGYEHSRTTDRLWRKNRNPNPGSSPYPLCKGVDLNRNFNFEFAGPGSASSPCKEIYRGTSAFSEPESAAVRDFVQPHAHEIDGFITLHSYSQIWMYPYGDQTNHFPQDVGELRDLALKATNKLASFYGTRYTVDTGANSLYPASGGSDDWSKLSAGIKFVYLIELRPTDPGSDKPDGFLLPENQIIPTARETWAGFMVVADEILRRSGFIPSPPEAEEV